MTEIFREIDEELREDRLKAQWKKYAPYAIGLVVVIIAGVAGYRGWQAYQLNQQQEAALLYQQSLIAAANENYGDAANGLESLAGSAPDGYAMLARMRQATVIAETGDTAGAAAAFESLAGDTSVDPIFQELALIRMAMVDAETGDPAALIDRLRPLAADGKPWRFTARELIAALQLRQGDVDGAREGFTALADDLDAPQGTRARATEMLRTLSN